MRREVGCWWSGEFGGETGVQKSLAAAPRRLRHGKDAAGSTADVRRTDEDPELVINLDVGERELKIAGAGGAAACSLMDAEKSTNTLSARGTLGCASDIKPTSTIRRVLFVFMDRII